MNSFEIVIGKIPTQEFQFACVSAVLFAKKAGSRISIVSPTRVLIYDFIIAQWTVEWFGGIIKTKEQKELYSFFEINYVNDEKIVCTGNLYREDERVVKTALEFSFSLQERNRIRAMCSTGYSFVFNPVSCFNLDTGEMENIRLTPYCSVLKEEDCLLCDVGKFPYGGHSYGDHQLMLMPNENLCAAKDETEEDIGDSCALTERLIVKQHTSKFNADEEYKCSWLTLCSFIKDSPLKIETELYLTSDDGRTAWLYLATTGIVYGKELVKAPMRLNTELMEIEYNDGCRIIGVQLTDEEHITVREEINGSVTTRIFCVEDRSEDFIAWCGPCVSDSDETLETENENPEVADFIGKTKQLEGSHYYDGTEFVPFITNASQWIIENHERLTQKM